jgi:hypothetical protein
MTIELIPANRIAPTNRRLYCERGRSSTPVGDPERERTDRDDPDDHSRNEGSRDEGPEPPDVVHPEVLGACGQIQGGLIVGLLEGVGSLSKIPEPVRETAGEVVKVISETTE